GRWGSGKRHVDGTGVHMAGKERSPIGGRIQIGRGRLHVAVVIVVMQTAPRVMPVTSGVRSGGKCQSSGGQHGQSHSRFFHCRLSLDAWVANPINYERTESASFGPDFFRASRPRTSASDLRLAQYVQVAAIPEK